MTLEEMKLRMTRRSFFNRTATGIGSIALASLLNPGLLLAANTSSAKAGLKWRGVVS